MANDTSFPDMLNALADLFASEGRAGGDEAAAALCDVAAKPIDLPPNQPPGIVKFARQALETRPREIASKLIAALPVIDWHFSGLDDGRIRPEIARQMVTCELIGPHGMVFHPSVRSGLFMQTPNLDYVTRTHPAEETFIMLGGSGEWSCNGAPPTNRVTGDVIFHPSNAPHYSVTKTEPLIAAWRWTGDISYDGYALVG